VSITYITYNTTKAIYEVLKKCYKLVEHVTHREMPTGIIAIFQRTFNSNYA